MTRAPLLYKLAAIAGLAAPLVILIAAAATGLGWLSFDLGFRVLTLQVGWVLIWVGLSLGLTAAAIWFRRRGPGLWLVLIAVLAPLATFLAFHSLRTQAYDLPPVHETATDWAEPLTFSRDRGQRAWPVEADPRVPEDVGDIHRAWAPWAGRRVAEINAEACPGARTVARLVETETVIAALEAEGVRVLGEAPWRVEGVQESPWYGRTRDVVVRMEPGATDIRVSERIGLTDLGDTCRLVSALVARLEPQAGR